MELDCDQLGKINVLTTSEDIKDLETKNESNPVSAYVTFTSEETPVCQRDNQLVLNTEGLNDGDGLDDREYLSVNENGLSTESTSSVSNYEIVTVSIQDNEETVEVETGRDFSPSEYEEVDVNRTEDEPGYLGPVATYIKHSENAYECAINGCGKILKSQRLIQNHASTHQDKSTYKYKCEQPECGKTFLRKYSLDVHTRTHQNIKPFMCSVCSKGFRASCDLERHTRIHKGFKPFLCPVADCGKHYTTSECLKVHIRTHTGIKPYSCTHEGCGKAFAAHSNLIAHSRIHQGIKPYVCQTCGKMMREYSTYYKHQNVHFKMGEMTAFKCIKSNCEKSFKDQSTLKRHVAEDHSLSVPLLPAVKSNENQNTPTNCKEREIENDFLALPTVILITATEMAGFQHTPEEVVNESLSSSVLVNCIEAGENIDGISPTISGNVDEVFTSEDDSSSSSLPMQFSLDNILHQSDSPSGLDDFMDSFKHQSVSPDDNDINFI